MREATTERFDTLLHGGRVIDPAPGLDATPGVTALVDQGGPSGMTLPGFRKFVAEPARSRVYAFLSAYLVGGIEGHYYPALYRPDCLDVDATVCAARENRDLVKGIKAHAEPPEASRGGAST